MKQGRILIVSGPSGVGKGTIVREVMKDNPSLQFSVSATTRAIRPGEIHALAAERDERHFRSLRKQPRRRARRLRFAGKIARLHQVRLDCGKARQNGARPVRLGAADGIGKQRDGRARGQALEGLGRQVRIQHAKGGGVDCVHRQPVRRKYSESDCGQRI